MQGFSDIFCVCVLVTAFGFCNFVFSLCTYLEVLKRGK